MVLNHCHTEHLSPTFAEGYKVPHPLENYILLRIRTTSDYAPEHALQQALADCITEVIMLTDKFQVCACWVTCSMVALCW
jgi:DNA-directed RNA polymerase subunit L